MITFLTFLTFFPFCALLLTSAYEDLHSMEISNWISIALALAFPLVAVANGMSAPAIGLALAVGCAVFFVGAGLFYLGLMGGGDVKIFSATAIWFGVSGFLPFLLWTAIAGGLFSALILLARRLPEPARDTGTARVALLQHVLRRESGVPYAVAIALGAFVAAGKAPVFQAALAG